MYLKELRLHGFKSFADPTRIDLQRGVTAIVGPNGCGKSNIADAIRWVLGEQSAKSLRAGAMQDVIFQGTTSRKPVNLCQVSLVFTDCEKSLKTAHNEVEVSRRVVRDGGSEYLLNGKPCRLKDIHNLFVDTGIGQVSYSFMLQGQIDQVLSSNPSERRAIFEEAAGISKYKAQRREALNKLAQVDANLSRVTDVIEEVARQTGSLKRQASKALRYKRIHHRLTHLDLAHNGFRFQQIGEDVESSRRKAASLEERSETLNRELESAEAGLTGRRNEALVLRQRLEAAQQAVYELRSEKENAANRAEMADLRIEDLSGRIAAIKAELDQLAKDEEVLAEKLAGETRLKREQMDLFGSSDEDFQKRSTELAALQQELNAEETGLASEKQDLQAQEGAVSRLRSNCTSLELDLKTYQVRHANLTEELKNLDNDREVLGQDLAELDKARRVREEARKRQEETLSELKDKRQELTHAYRDLQQNLQETERTRASVQARMGVLEGLQEKFEGFSEGAKAILQGSFSETIPTDGYKLLLKELKVADGYTGALEMLLGTAADGLFLRDVNLLRPLVRSLGEKRVGRASLLTAAEPSAPEGAKPASLPPEVRPATAVASSTDTEIQRFLDVYLSGCYIADDAEGFLAFVEGNGTFTYRLAVTRKGELIDPRGLILAGAARNGKENSSFLSRQNQLKKHARELGELGDKEERLRLEAAQVQGRLDSLEKRIEEQNGLLSETGTEITTLATQKAGLEQSIQSNGRNREAKQQALSELESQKEASTGRLETARAELAAAEERVRACKERIARVETAVESLRGRREHLREQLDEVKFEVARKRQRLELLDRGLDELQRKSREAEETRVKRLREIEQVNGQIEALKAEVGQHGEAGKAIEEKLRSRMAGVDADREALKELERAIASVEEGFAPKREEQQRLAGELNKAQVGLARLESKLQFIQEECQCDYERDPGEIDWKLEFWKAGDELPERIRVDIEETTPEEMEALQERPDPTDEERASIEPVDWEEVETEIKALRSRIQTMGPVNLVAIEEYKELKERHEFLSSQSEDLWKAKEQLLQAIDEINTTSQKLFSETFEKIRNNFLYTFETLFGGGKAGLELVDKEDVLESGIDITAQPPGTRLRNLGLLSGGQKTMTAVALLFAIYMVKPSPFCVLDEIDAPLDDANIGRFTGMLEGFLEYSQFLIITHNKRTISVADTIYGATMQEKGVSRLVSMRFNKATGKAEAATGEAPVT